MRQFFLAILLGLAIAAPPVTAQAEAGSPVWEFSEADPVMNAAMADAKKSLPVFLEQLKSPAAGVTMLSLKVAVGTDIGSVEHIWVDQIRQLEDGTFEAVYANDPVDFEGNLGDPVTFDEKSISDWSYLEDGFLHGNYTTRVMLPQIDAESAASLKEILAPLPEVGQ
jgi:uncharacterized protein YegJ (DUF2314 family)